MSSHLRMSKNIESGLFLAGFRTVSTYSVIGITQSVDRSCYENYSSFRYLLTPWSRVLPENLTGFQLVKKFPTFYGTRRFITAFTSARHLSLSWASSIQSIPQILLPEDPSKYFPPIYAWVSQVASFPQVFPPKPCILLSSPPYALHAPPILFSILSPGQYWVSTDHSAPHYAASTPLSPRPS